MNFLDRFEQCYVDKLPEACVGCPFLGVDNKLWAGVEKGYVSTQWCRVNGEHMEERLFESRHKDCPLKVIKQEDTPLLMEEPIYDYPLEDSVPPQDYYQDVRWKDRFDFDSMPIDSQLAYVLKNYKRQIETKVLYDILVRFYFADWTRQCNYENMTQEELIQCMMDVCKKIEKDYKYSVDDDLYPMPWGGDDYDL